MSARIDRNTLVRTLAMIILGAAAPRAEAQIGYPSFQPPRVIAREYNFAIADAEGLTPIVFQWREGLSPGSQLSLDAGFADPEAEGADLFLILGGQYGRQLALARADMPLDLMLTVGLAGMFGNDLTFISVPVGVSLGHRFPIEGTGMSITPYAHPRLSLDHVSNGDADDSELAINFDLGGSLEFNARMALRVSATLGDADAIGISFAYAPRGLAAPARARAGIR
jgi:hypothetical protein